MKVQKTRILADIHGEQAVIYFMSTHIREMGDVQKIMEEIGEIAANYRVNLMIINFSKLRQLTSAFLSRLIALNQDLRKLKIKLRLCSMSPQVERAYRICRLQKIIPLYATERKALH